jgi:hypothetical protein
MRKAKLITLLMVLVVLSAGSAAYAAPCGAGAPGWNCSTSITRSGSTSTCTATATSPGGSYNIFMYGGGPGGKALHLGATYYGSNNTKSCTGSTCTIKFTYTGSAMPNLCNWFFTFS